MTVDRSEIARKAARTRWWKPRGTGSKARATRAEVQKARVRTETLVARRVRKQFVRTAVIEARKLGVRFPVIEKVFKLSKGHAGRIWRERKV